jgi:hypothetical protein
MLFTAAGTVGCAQPSNPGEDLSPSESPAPRDGTSPSPPPPPQEVQRGPGKAWNEDSEVIFESRANVTSLALRFNLNVTAPEPCTVALSVAARGTGGPGIHMFAHLASGDGFVGGSNGNLHVVRGHVAGVDTADHDAVLDQGVPVGMSTYGLDDVLGIVEVLVVAHWLAPLPEDFGQTDMGDRSLILESTCPEHSRIESPQGGRTVGLTSSSGEENGVSINVMDDTGVGVANVMEVQVAESRALVILSDCPLYGVLRVAVDDGGAGQTWTVPDDACGGRYETDADALRVDVTWAGTYFGYYLVVVAGLEPIGSLDGFLAG